MKVTVIGTHLCPDTLRALAQLTAAEVEYEFCNMLASHDNLRAYLKLRENHELYANVRGNSDSFGIPCFVLEDGKVTMDLGEILK